MIVSLKTILEEAYKGHYAVGAFNILSLEHLRGAIAAAEELSSPIIIQLAEVQFPAAPMELMAPLYLSAAKSAKVPVTVHLDHGQSLETCLRAMKLGFNSVMFDGANLPFEENVRQTLLVSSAAKASGVDVEAELGKVGDVGCDMPADVFTDVDESEKFIEQTGVDALAVAIGNLHGRYISTPKLNIARLKELSGRNNLPLVLHGGSGTSEADFKSCIHNGISKINVATALQVAVAEKIAEYISSSPRPDYISMKEIMVEATKESVMQHILLFESNGKA